MIYQGSFDHVKVGPTPVFGITQFVTPNRHVLRHPGVKNRKQKKYLNKTVLVTWSQTWGKMAYIVRKVTLKKIILKTRTFMG